MVVSAFVGSSSAASILLGNDDGFASAQLREFYRLLKASGHEVIVVAPVDNESGQGGRSQFSTMNTLAVPSEFGIIPAGAPALGRDPSDPDVWYYNGTPAACTYVALDYVIPNFYNNKSIDLYVGGPNFGLNAGYFYYTLSGTIGKLSRYIEAASPEKGVQIPTDNSTSQVAHTPPSDATSRASPSQAPIPSNAVTPGSTRRLPQATRTQRPSKLNLPRTLSTSSSRAPPTASACSRSATA